MSTHDNDGDDLTLLRMLSHDLFISLDSSVDSTDDSFVTASDGTCRDSLDSLLQLHSSSFHVVHINAQSLLQHYDYLRIMFQSQLVHVISVSETWLKPSLDSQLVYLPGYVLYRNDRTGKGAGGVGMYVREDLHVKHVDSSPSDYHSMSEFLFLEISFSHNKLLCGVIYKPPGVDNNFNDYESCLFHLVPKYEHIIISGDHNSDLLSDKTESRHVRVMYESCQLNILPFQPTHHKAILDLLVVKDVNRVASHGQLSAPGFSYHDLIFLSYSLKTPKFTPKYITYRNLKNININNLLNDSSQVPWSDVQLLHTVDDKVNLFNVYLLSLYDRHAPLVTKRVTHPPSPWLTLDIRKLMRKRDRLYRRFKKTDNLTFLTRYKQLRNRVNQLIRNSKLRLAHTLCEETGRTLWKKLRVWSVGKKVKPLPSELDPDLLNNHFCNSVPQADPLTVLNTVVELNLLPRPNFPEFEFLPVNSTQVKQALLSIKSNAEGCDGINIKLLKLIIEHILPSLTHIFNFSFSSGVFPDIWKHARIRPLAKVMTPTGVGDYRPISILPALSKVAEKLVCTQLTRYLSNHNLLDRFQSGFRNKHSTSTALTCVLDDLGIAVDSGLVSLLSLLDFSKAFDSVNFEILLAKLSSFNLSNNVINWFRSYLFGRSQSVLVNNKSSCLLSVSCGVPQGSVLGPLLFSIYLSGISSCFQHCSYHLYADDLQVYLSSSIDDFSHAVDKLNSDLQAVKRWSDGNMLTLNPSKCQVMIVGFPTSLIRVFNNSPKPVIISDQIIPYERKSVKNLGVYFDPNLSWDQHTTHLCKKIFSILHYLNKLKYLLPVSVKAKLIQSLVIPVVDYCDVVFAGLSVKNSNRIQKVFNTCVRFIFNSKRRDHITPLLKQLSWLKLTHRRSLHSLSFLHNISSNNSPVYLTDRVNKLSTDRNGTMFEIKRHTTLLYSSTFVVRAVREWNNLPREIRSLPQLNKFKTAVHNHYIQQY